MFAILSAEIDLYGASVVDAFGAYCFHQARILRRRPGLRSKLWVVSKMIRFIEDGGFAAKEDALDTNYGV